MTIPAGQSVDAEETLRQAAQRVEQIVDSTTQANLMAASGILAGLKLEEEAIISSIAEGHHAGVSYLSIYSGRSRGEKAKRNCQ